VNRAEPSSEPLFAPDSDLVTGPVVDGTPEEPELAVAAIQGAVLPGFATPFQHLAGIRFPDGDAARRWLGRWTGTVSSLAEVMAYRNESRRALRAGGPRPSSPVWTGLALSAGGLRLLGVDPREVGDPAFAAGLWPRSGLLGDPVGEEGDRRGWVVGGDEESTPHVLVVLGGPTEESLDERLAALHGDPETTVGFSQRGATLEGEREHFGFRDGVSQVGVRGRLSGAARHFLTRRWIDPADARARAWARPGQPLVWPGQFVFGYPRQDRTDELRPLPASPVPDWVTDGSLLAFRRLRQDVPRFRAFTAAESARLREVPGFEAWSQDRFEAALVGRWPDGSALMRTGGAPDPSARDDLLAANHFGYGEPAAPVDVCADPEVAHEALAGLPEELRTVPGAVADPDGERCPRFAHVRKVNPRDRTTDQGGREATLPTQVLRRGIPWGRPYVPGEPDGDADRGLLFMCWQTSLEDQFELLTARWMNQDRRPEVLAVSGHDVLVGQAPVRRCVFRGAEGRSEPVSTNARWIVPTGGGYFFGPSLPTLHAWAELA
jgi:Dyp-type peroxidase family